MSAIEIVRLESDALEVELLPALGCRLHRLRAFGFDVLRTPADPATHADDPFFWGAYVMAPWTNRASARPMTIAGRTVDLPSNFADGTAIHGQVYLAPWLRTGAATFSIEREGGGWPWPYRVTAEVAVDGPRLRLRYLLANRSDVPMPAGIGLHPWWVRPVEVALEAAAVHPRNDDPAARHVDPTGGFDLRLDREPPRGLDATWLHVDPPAVRLRQPAAHLDATMSIRRTGESPHVAVASPDDPDAVAVEPVTHVPWALDHRAAGRAGAMDLLDGGRELALEIELEVARAPER